MLPASFRIQLEGIFREHHAWLHGRLLRRLSNRCEAEDVASETFLRLTEDGGRTEVRDARAFLTTLAKRVLFQRWRRNDLEQAYLETLRQQPEVLALSPEDRAVLIDAIQCLDEALGELPEAVRTAFLLSRLDGMSYPAIAVQLEALLKRSELQPFFREGLEVHTETTLIDAQGKAVRPDRIVREGDRFRILDIKTGTPSDRHQEQVKGYVQLLQKVEAKPVEGFLLYMRDGALMPVKA